MTHRKAARRPVDAPTAANDVAEATRRLNHALQDAAAKGDWPVSPTDAYDIVGALTLAVQRLPYALNEVDGIASEPDGLRVDDGTDPAMHLHRVSKALGDALQHADALADALNAAWSLLGVIGHVWGER
ncbi:hypothetical protein LO772_24525 [Yinghuangia sp. ASG 101]|uniref:hypothetical protein n=1 Tax=Yinghuangia sp. ASG 101 TaxID=2896848 RepID=UPI001E6510E9|nr:hypothetical protein [Yinghuangia sp. ASG 101]UGQ10035.1 hypothetical protein LO772_24525 [Yinghuangia sp. ASG 101]